MPDGTVRVDRIVAEFEADTTQATAAVRKYDKEIDKTSRTRKGKIEMEVDDSRLTKAKKQIDEAAADREIRLKPAVEGSRLAKANAEIEKAAKERGCTIRVEADGTRVVEAEIDHAARDRHTEIHVDVDQKSVAASKAKLKGLQGQFLELSGIAQSGEFLKGALLIPAAFQAAGPAVSVVKALTGQVLSLGGAIQTMGGSALAAPAALGAAASAFGTFKLATLGLKDAYKAFGSSMEKTNNDIGKSVEITAAFLKGKVSAAAVETFGRLEVLKGGFKALGVEVQRPIFEQVNRGLYLLRNVAADLAPAFLGMSETLGKVIKRFFDWAGATETVQRVSRIISGSTPIIKSFGGVIVNVADSFLRLAEVGQPFFSMIASGMEAVSRRINDWVKLNQWTGELNIKMAEGFLAVRRFGEAIRDFGVGFGNIFKASKDSGNDLLKSIGEIADKFRSWTATMSGQNSIKKFIEDGQAPMHEFYLLVRDVGKALWSLGDSSGAGTFVTIAKILRTQLLPVLTQVLDQSKNSGIIEALVSTFADLLKVFAALKGPSVVLKGFIELIGDFATVFADFIDAFPDAGQAITNFTTALGLLKIVGVGGWVGVGLGALVATISYLTGDLKDAVPVIAGFAAAWAGFKITQYIGQFGMLATAIGDVARNVSAMPVQGIAQTFSGIGSSTKQAITGIKGVQTAAQGATTQTGALTGAMAGGAGLMTASIGVGAVVAVAGVALTQYMQHAAEASQRTDDLKASFAALEEPTYKAGDGFKMIKKALFEGAKDVEIDESLKKLGITYDKLTTDIIGSNIRVKKSGKDWTLETIAGFTAVTGSLEEFDNTASPAVKRLRDQLADNAEGFLHWAGDASNASAAIGDLTDNVVQASLAYVEEKVMTGQLTREQANLLLSRSRNADETLNVTKLTDGLNIALTGETRATNEAIAAQKNMGDQLALQKQYYKSIISNGSAMVATEDGIKAKIMDVTQALKDNNKGFEDSTREGLTNRDSIRSLYQVYVDQARAMINAGSSAEEAGGKYAEFTDQLRLMEEKGLIAKGSTDQLLESLKLTAVDWNANLQVTLMENAQGKMDLIKATLESIGRKEGYTGTLAAALRGDWDQVNKEYAVSQWFAQNPDMAQRYTVDQVTNFIQTGTIPPTLQQLADFAFEVKRSQGRGRLADSRDRAGVQMAKGGVLEEQFSGATERHVAQIAPAGAWRIWAEPETGGEAYIPLAPAKRQRSIAIWHETGKRLGALTKRPERGREVREEEGGLLYFAGGGMFKSLYPNSSQFAPPPAKVGSTPPRETPFRAPALSPWNPLVTAATGFIPSDYEGHGINVKVNWTPLISGDTGLTPEEIAALGPVNGSMAGLLAQWKGKPGSYKAIMAYGSSTGTPMRAISTVRPGAIIRGNGRPSLHSMSRAVDWAPPGGGVDNPGLLAIERAFLPVRSILHELIYSGPGSSSIPNNPITRADHHNHVHVGLEDGGILAEYFKKGGIKKAPKKAPKKKGVAHNYGSADAAERQIRNNQKYRANVPAGTATPYNGKLPKGSKYKGGYWYDWSGTKKLAWSADEDGQLYKFTPPTRHAAKGYMFSSVPEVPALAEGGIVRKPTLAMIGEAGPEAVVPLSKGGILNFAQGGFAEDGSWIPDGKAFYGPGWNPNAVDAMSQRFKDSGLAEQFNALEKLGKYNVPDWFGFLDRISKMSNPFEAMNAVTDRYTNAKNFLEAAARNAVTNAPPPPPPPTLSGAQNPALGYGRYLTYNNKDKLSLSASSDYREDVNNRVFSQQVLEVIRQMGADVVQTGFDTFELDTTRVTDIDRLGLILEGMMGGGWGVSENQSAAAAATAQAKTVPYVVVNNPIFKDEADLDMLNRKIEWAVRTDRL